jgi:hypothetical protein
VNGSLSTIKQRLNMELANAMLVMYAPLNILSAFVV